MPAIRSEDLKSQAILRTDYIELHFHQTEGLSSPTNKQLLYKAYSSSHRLDTQALANFVKNHQDLSLYWDRCEAEKIDEMQHGRR